MPVSLCSQESRSSTEIAESLSLSGTGEYNGGAGLKVSASASYLNDRLSSSTAYLATLAKRVYQVPDSILGTLQLSDLPKLNADAIQDLQEYGPAYFAEKYGTYFVHSVLYKAYADAWAQAFTTEDSSTTVVGATLSGEYAGFSASMEANWNKSQKTAGYKYTVITSSSYPCASRSFDTLEDCSNQAIQNKAPGQGHRIILYRIADLPDYQRIISKPVLPTQTPYDLLGNTLKAGIARAWARGQYLLLTVGRTLKPQSPDDCNPRCFQKNVIRIIQVLSDLTANKDLDTKGSVIFLAASQDSVSKMRIIKHRVDILTRSFTGSLSPLDNTVNWASVGPGVLVTLFANSVSDKEATAFHMGEGITKAEAFKSQGFASQASAVKVEYIAGMDIDRKTDLVDILKQQLNDLEVNAKWSTGE